MEDEIITLDLGFGWKKEETTHTEDKTTKKERLIEVNRKLKEHFVGIDGVIDEITQKIRLWYINPEILTRPTIINLYGLTGVGKTDLIIKLIDLLGFEKKSCIVELDNNSTSTNINDIRYGRSNNKGYIGFKLLNNYIKPIDQSILLLDEIQRFRTVFPSENGSYYRKNEHYDDVWRLLSDGQLYSKQLLIKELDDHINNMEGAWQSAQNSDMRHFQDEKMNIALGMMPVTTSNLPNNGGSIKSQVNKFIKESYNSIYIPTVMSCIDITQEDIYYIMMLKMKYQGIEACVSDISRGYNTVENAVRLLRECSNKVIWDLLIYKQQQLIEDTDDSRDARRKYVYSKMLIFICGNMEELYKKFNYKIENIGLNDIKDGLKSMFRDEQVSRFGNNYILYPILSEKDYKTILTRELTEIENELREKYNDNTINVVNNVNIHKEMKERINNGEIDYLAGVRPFLSTVNNVISNHIPDILANYIEI